MTLVWSPETASKAYLDTIQICEISSKTTAAEFLSAIAAGYNAKLIVEVRKKQESGNANIPTSTGLAIAAKHTHGRHICVVPEEASRVEYVSAMHKLLADVSLPEVVVGEVEEVMRKKLIYRVHFLIVDGGRKDFARALTSVKLSQHGAILVCKSESKRNNISVSSRFSWKGVLDAKVNVVRAITLPFGNYGLEIAYIASSNYDGSLKSRKNPKHWIRHVDQDSGEEHVFRR
ncbi:uncharacterized protein LOC132062637 [Lycium ferocissimum]|uniref:uncharacterized protein LOC132062637 n=1 Tax=Lycium ferocissimum TaxID=112874 RepID=UPI002815974E|nr:uncharacterized protein LOC132062637 [Lycium ferocissimum]